MSNETKLQSFIGIAMILVIGLVADKIIKESIQENNREASKLKVSTNNGHDYEVVVIDGCQYLESKTHGSLSVVAHKGNCTNRIHVYAVEK